VIKPSQRREMAREAIVNHSLSVRQRCRGFGTSETCYRYQAKFSDRHAEIADWLLRLTEWQRSWGSAYVFDTCAMSKASAGTISALIGSTKN
jgi:putative transposase